MHYIRGYEQAMQRKRKSFQVKTPDGQVMTCHNLPEFCFQHRLNPQAVRLACRGKRVIEGWHFEYV